MKRFKRYYRQNYSSYEDEFNTLEEAMRTAWNEEGNVLSYTTSITDTKTGKVYRQILFPIGNETDDIGDYWRKHYEK